MASLNENSFRKVVVDEQAIWEQLRKLQELKWVELLRGKQVQFVLERVVHKILFIALFAFFASRLLRWLASNQMICFLFCFGLLISAYYVLQSYDIRAIKGVKGRVQYRSQVIQWNMKSGLLQRLGKKDWRQRVGSELVSVAWEALVGSILQEWVYDAWYGLLTPDKEFPAAVRQLLDELFGQLCERIKRVDIKELLISDLLQLVSSQLSLFREVRATIGEQRLQAMKSHARERAMRQELLTEGNLHHALETRDSQYRHLSLLSDALLSNLLILDDSSSEIVHVVGRELLTSCVLRPIVWLFTPYQLNKIFLQMVASSEFNQQINMSSIKSDKSQEQHGVFVFEERFRKSIRLEERQLNFSSSLLYTTPATPTTSYDKKYRIKGTNSSQLPKVKSVDSSLNEQLANVKSNSTVASANSILSIAQHISKSSYSDQEELMPQEGVHEEQLVEDVSARSSNALPTVDFGSRNGFVGRARAKVATSEIRFGGSSKRKTTFVAFVIRAGDDQGEWSVTRRFRNFEDLDVALRRSTSKKMAQRYEEFSKIIKLPRKLIFSPHISDSKVEQRRQGLNTYLEALLRDKELATSPELWEFLNPNSNMYLLDIDVGFLRSLGFNINKASQHSSNNGVRRPTLRGTTVKQSIAKEEYEVAGKKAETVDLDMRPLIEIQQTSSSKEEQLSEFVVSPSYTSLSMMWKQSQESGKQVNHGHRRSVSHDYTIESQDTKQQTDTSFSSLNRPGGEVHCEDDSVVDDSDQSENLDDQEDTLMVVQSFVWFIDTLFQLHARGIRKTFNTIIMQFFQIVAADGVDAWVMSWISNLRSEHFVARSINQLRLQLWPSGTWFGYLPPHSDPSKPYYLPPSRPEHITPEGFMSTHVDPQEANRLSSQVKQVLFSKIPERLVAVVGRQAVSSGLKDLYQLMQSDIFMSQIGYIAIDRVLGELFPEMESFLEEIPSKLKRQQKR